MAVIQPYEQKVAPQGGLAVQSTPEQFGAGVGAALQNFGASGMKLAETMYRNEIENDVTAVHVETAKARDRLQQKVAEMGNQTQPGDTTFVDRVRQVVQDDMDALGSQFKTKQGQDLFARMSANMVSMYSQQAVAVQSDLQGEFARNQFVDTRNSLGNIAAQDHTQVKDLIAQGEALINDPNGRFAKIPESKREAFRAELRTEIQYQAGLGFARRYPNAVLGQVPAELRGVVQQINSGVQQPASTAGGANPSVKPVTAATGPVPNFNASDVKPYNTTRVNDLAKVIAQPSQYDQFFTDAAQLYNLDPRELKLRAVAESGLNPTALSKKNAMGIMQFVPATAKALGVNPNDPKAAIFAAAKLISDYRTKAGGDMTLVDKMYYGGESGTKWGPNTAQYAANLAALRQASGIGSQVTPQELAPTPAQQIAQTQDWKKPRTGIDFIDSLPADKFFAVLSHAEQYQRAYDAQSERERMEKERAKRQAADDTMASYLARIVMPGAENGGQLTEREVVGNPLLSSAEKDHMIARLRAETVYRRDARNVKTDPDVFNNLYSRIVAPDGDPRKLYDPSELYNPLRQGQLTPVDHDRLMSKIREMKDGSGRGFQNDLNNVLANVSRELQASTVLQGLSEVDIGLRTRIQYEFNRDLERKIDAYRSQNKNPSDLFDPNSKDYVLKPGYLNKYIPTLNTLAQNVSREPQDGKVVGESYLVNGQVKQYLGGPVNLTTSWK